jgi:hypothetical protein
MSVIKNVLKEYVDMDHWPVENEKRTRCKNPGCKGNTFMMCNKCQVNLCCGKGLACFTKWHTT